MTVPWLIPAVGFALGICLSWISFISDVFMWGLLVVCLSWLWFFRSRRIFLFILAASVVCLGFHAGRLRHHISSNDISYWTIESEEERPWVYIEGKVLEDPEKKEKGKKITYTFSLDAQSILYYEESQRRLYPASGKLQVFLFQPSFVPAIGDRVRIRGQLEKPRSLENPGQFDYRKYLSERGIYAILKSYGKKTVWVVGNESSFFQKGIRNLRLYIAKKIEEAYRPEHAPLLKALLLGQRRELDPLLRDAFIKTGTAHLLAISGLHITLISGTLYGLLLAFRQPQKLAAVCALGICTLYVFIAGCGIPVQRAGTMVGLSLIAVSLERPHRFLNAFCFAFFWIAWMDPLRLNNLSFQLSFLSVFSLIYVLPGIRSERWRWSESFIRSLGILAGTLPLMLKVFYLFTPVSLLANAVTIPLFHMALAACFIALAGSFIPFWMTVWAFLSEKFVDLGIICIERMGEIPGGSYYLPSPPVWAMVFYWVALAAAAFAQQKKWSIISRFACWTLWSISLFFLFSKYPSRPFELVLFAAGKNELMYTNSKGQNHWLINAGRSAPSDQARWILLPFLKSRGINHLNGVFVTDDYRRHTGGLKTLFSSISIGHIFHSQQARHSELKNFCQRTNCVSMTGDVIRSLSAEGMNVLYQDGQQMIIQWVIDGWSFLYLSRINEVIIQALQKNKLDVQKTHVLILPSRTKRETLDPAWLEVFDEVMDPLFAVQPHTDRQLASYLSERDIFYWDSLKEGAIRISLVPDDFSPVENMNRLILHVDKPHLDKPLASFELPH